LRKNILSQAKETKLYGVPMRTLIFISNFHDVMKTSVIIQNGGTFRNLNVDDEGIRDLILPRIWQNPAFLGLRCLLRTTNSRNAHRCLRNI
jgi:hypothetical protein